MVRLAKMMPQSGKSSGQIYVQDRISQYRAMWAAIAKDSDATFTEIAPDLWEIEKNGRRTRILNDILEFDNYVILEMAGKKPLIYKLFDKQGLSVPDYKVFTIDQYQTTFEFLEKYPIGCVIKPANGTSSGQGVTTHIRTKSELRKAAILASLYNSELMIEPMIPGECYRLLVLEGNVVHAVCRRGLRLIGNGSATIAELVSIHNANCEKIGEPIIEYDTDTIFTLSYQNLTTESVPANGEAFLIKSINDSTRKQVEVRTVYNETVTDSVCESILQDARRAAEILRSDFVGVDFITKDISVPLSQSGGVINEVNTTPGLHHHYDSSKERYPEPSLKILEALLRKH